MLRIKLDKDTFATLVRRGKARGMQLVELVSSTVCTVRVSGTDTLVEVSIPERLFIPSEAVIREIPSDYQPVYLLDDNSRYILANKEFKYDGEEAYVLDVVDGKLLIEVGSCWFSSRRFLLTDFSRVSL
jgi:hypothetical protein